MSAFLKVVGDRGPVGLEIQLTCETILVGRRPMAGHETELSVFRDYNSWSYFTAGKNETQYIGFPSCLAMSRLHFEIRLERTSEGFQYFVSDLRSHGGTFVNRIRFRDDPLPLNHGDNIETYLEFEFLIRD